jgi:hypothetical protein
MGLPSLDLYQVKDVALDESSSGDNEIVAAIPGKRIAVVQLALISNGTVNAKFQSGAGGTGLTGLFYLVANTGFVLPKSDHPWFLTAIGSNLNLNLSAAIAVGGVLSYIEVG